jgi:hypothetical protein
MVVKRLLCPSGVGWPLFIIPKQARLRATSLSNGARLVQAVLLGSRLEQRMQYAGISSREGAWLAQVIETSSRSSSM